MAKAIWNGIVLAESADTVLIEGNHYFPPESVNQQYFQPTRTKTRCFWKGLAHYYDIQVNGQTNSAAAWYYPKPWPLAHGIKDYVAFWRGVQIVKS